MREWDDVLSHGERWIEGTFFRRARAMGNDIGYDSIVGGGRHATTLHWIENSGPITPGELVLLDMGVEGRNLYTADVTRTLPVDGTFTSLQRELYTLVLDAQQAGIEAVRPGVPFLAALGEVGVGAGRGLQVVAHQGLGLGLELGDAGLDGGAASLGVLGQRLDAGVDSAGRLHAQLLRLQVEAGDGLLHVDEALLHVGHVSRTASTARSVTPTPTYGGGRPRS